jgi:hypothetical protein
MTGDFEQLTAEQQFHLEEDWREAQLEKKHGSLDDNESICSSCGKITPDETTKFDDAGDPYCPECYDWIQDKHGN